MQTADIVILALLIVPGLIGILYGFLNLVFSLVAWICAFGISVKFSAFFTPMLATYIDTVMIRNVLAFVGLFIISLMILSALGYFIVKLLGRAGLTATDRLLGFFLGIGLGGFIVAAAVFLAGFTIIPREPWWQASMIIPPLERVAVWGQKFLPENVAKEHSYDVDVPTTQKLERS